MFCLFSFITSPKSPSKCCALIGRLLSVCSSCFMCVFPSCASRALCVLCATFACHKISHQVTKTSSLNKSLATFRFSSSFLCCHNIMRKLRNECFGSGKNCISHKILFIVKLTVKSISQHMLSHF